MSHGCSYCGRSGHNVTTCPDRQRDYFGTPGDPSAAMADQTRTDGGTDSTGTDQEKVAESDDAGVSEAASIETVVDGPEDHDRATRELALGVANLVDEALDETEHPVKITLDAEVDGGTDSAEYGREGIDVRPRMPDTPEEWKQVAEDEDVVVMLEAEDQAVFVAHVETDEFGRGYKWIANSIDPESGVRSNSFATHENLIDRWFQEAVPNCRAWKMDPDETPLEVDRDDE